MIAYNETNNHKNSRNFELIFKEYYETQNAIKLIDMNEVNPYATYDFRDDTNKYIIEIRHRKEFNRDDLTYVMFNKDKLERLYELQKENKKYKILNYQYVYNDEDGIENYKLYVIDMGELIGESLATCQDNQGKTCYKIPFTYYNKIREYPLLINNNI
jgi:hypothetical protein